MRNYRSSETADSPYQRNIQSKNYHIREYTSIEAEENSSVKNAPKALQASSDMVLAKSKSQIAETKEPASQILTETRSDVVTDSEIILEEQSEKPLISKTIAKLLPPARNHPPIEQFTPEKNDTSETFTSKLKAIVAPK